MQTSSPLTITPGSSSLLHTLSTHVLGNTHTSDALDDQRNIAALFDPVIFQAVLLALVASPGTSSVDNNKSSINSQAKHIILRTEADDVAGVARVVASMLTQAFAYSTQRIRLRPPSEPLPSPGPNNPNNNDGGSIHRRNTTPRPSNRFSASNVPRRPPSANSKPNGKGKARSTSRTKTYEEDSETEDGGTNAFLRSLFLSVPPYSSPNEMNMQKENTQKDNVLGRASPRRPRSSTAKRANTMPPAPVNAVISALPVSAISPSMSTPKHSKQHSSDGESSMSLESYATAEDDNETISEPYLTNGSSSIGTRSIASTIIATPSNADPFATVNSPQPIRAWNPFVTRPESMSGHSVVNSILTHTGSTNAGLHSNTANISNSTHSNTSVSMAATVNRPSGRHAFTDPHPRHSGSSFAQSAKRNQNNRTPTARRHAMIHDRHLPRALVITGLENGSCTLQRSLGDVLRDGNVVLESRTRRIHDDEKKRFSNISGETDMSEGDEPGGTWPLPDGFLLVYVCPLDPNERPQIMKGLLDRFAMSVSINLQLSTRAALRSLTLTRTSSGLGGSSLFNLQNPPRRRPSPHSPPTPTDSPNPLARIQSNQQQQQSIPQVTTVPLVALPFNIITTLRAAMAGTFIPIHLTLYAADLLSAARHHNLLDGTLLSARARDDVDILVRASRVLGIGGDKGSLVEIEHLSLVDQFRSSLMDFDDTLRAPKSTLLEISAADFGRIVPRVIAHRLRTRDGPWDEILGGAGYSAVENVQIGHERRNVKDILVEILSEV